MFPPVPMAVSFPRTVAVLIFTHRSISSHTKGGSCRRAGTHTTPQRNIPHRPNVHPPPRPSSLNVAPREHTHMTHRNQRNKSLLLPRSLRGSRALVTSRANDSPL